MCRLKTNRIIEEAMIAFHNNKVGEAFELLNHELSQDFNSVEILNALGDLNYLSDNLTGALDCWEKSLAINYNQVNILFNTALICQQNNEHKKVLKLYSKLLAINPHDIESLNSELTYKLITELSEKAKIILIDLYISVFTSLNNVLSNVSTQVNLFKETESKTRPANVYETVPPLRGGKTKKLKKRNNYTRKY